MQVTNKDMNLANGLNNSLNFCRMINVGKIPSIKGEERKKVKRSEKNKLMEESHNSGN
jgi:hypothetical protein